MEPIVDPMLFYWIGVCDDAKIVAVVVSMLLLVIGVFGQAFCNDFDMKIPKWFFKLVWVLVVIFGLCSVFVPTSRTLTQMLVARNVTPDNLKVVQGVAVDARDSLKADIIDIIRAVTEKKDEKK